MKSLLPSLREKKRYVAFEVISQSLFSNEDVYGAVRTKVRELFGHFGAASAGIQNIPQKWDQQKQRGIIRVSHNHVDLLKSAFIFVDSIKQHEIVVRSLGTSGILRKAQKKYIAG